MSTKKKGSRAKVGLNAKTLIDIESRLRRGLAALGAAYEVETKKLKLKSTASVKLDPATVARFTEHLRKGLASAGAIYEGESNKLNTATKKLKKLRSR